MPAREQGLRDQQKDPMLATSIRNLLLYGLLFHLFAFEAASLFSHESEREIVADVSSDAGNLYNQLLLPTAFLISCILVYVHRVPGRVLRAAMIPMGPLLLLIALSTVWSEYPELTIRRASHEIIEVMTFALLAACFTRPIDILKIFFRACLAVSCLDLLSAAIFPDSITVLGFAGIHGHKNLAGQFLFVALPVYLLGTFYKEISGNRLLGLFGLLSGIAMLVLTESKTSAGATIVGLSLVLLTRGLSRRDPNFRVLLLLVCFLVLLCAIAALINWSPDELLEMLIGDPTLTGRDSIWRYATAKFDASPFLGTGYGAIWQVGPSIQVALKEMGIFLVFNEAHNGYLEIAAQLGIAGLLCLSIFLIMTLFNAISYWATIEKHRFCGVGAFTIYIFWGLVLSNITESLYFQSGLTSSGTLMFLGAFVASRKSRSMVPSMAKGGRPAFAPMPYA